MRIARNVAAGLIVSVFSLGCGSGGDLPVAPSAEEAKKALDAAGPDAAAKAEPGLLKQDGKFGGVEKKVNSPAPASPM
jgi:hypothetical protein